MCRIRVLSGYRWAGDKPVAIYKTTRGHVYSSPQHDLDVGTCLHLDNPTVDILLLT
jgi:hypothetical protein